MKVFLNGTSFNTIKLTLEFSLEILQIQNSVAIVAYKIFE